ncbi:MAG: M20/M25/M40 family metallo-hydrolase [Pseudomonadales bacterium]|jgi:acetylornithine deacetylase/succinyl-diaminopimelate desuccinylase-like protein|nr:M20/M25/M40 family metallo-hydrolase [Pseudomonadales bacterium]
MTIIHRVRALLGLLALLTIGVAQAAAPGQSVGTPRGGPDPDAALERLAAYLRIDTTNPPGNEARAVSFLAEIFTAEGIPFETFEAAPGRGSIVARLEGGDAPALMLLNHSDVVPADASAWTVPPFAAEIRDGFLYGRGALDTKGLAMIQLEAFLALHRSGRRLDRDLLFAATADEEAGGYFGAGWMVRQRPDLFEGVGFVLNEGGGGRLTGDTAVFGVEVTQKIPLWLRLTARGTPGHGSAPRVDSAPNALVRALDRVVRQRFAPRLVPAVGRYMTAVADLQSEALAPLYADPSILLDDPEALLRLQLESPSTHALLRDTCSLTRLAASLKINVIPGTAWAELDCRLLPDTDPDAFIAKLEVLIDDPDIQVTRLMGFTAASSDTTTALYAAMESVLTEAVPGARVVPTMAAGFTDSHFFRDLGIPSYGFGTLLLPPSEYAGVHGNDERVNLAAYRDAVRLYHAVVERFVAP